MAYLNNMSKNNVSSFVQTPNSLRTHIAIFGRPNSGKSSLINKITKQNVSIVSHVEGTTTDPVKKAMEIKNLGPCLFIDTAGINDVSCLGKKKKKKTLEIINQIDMAIVLINELDFEEELEFIKKIHDVSKVIVINKIDILEPDYLNELEKKIFEKTNLKPIKISAQENINIDVLINNLVKIKPYQETSIVRDLICQGDFVLSVMPQDIQAPQGRLILPQVQIIRDLLDNKAIVTCVTKENFLDALKILNQNLKLIITDSQIFSFIAENTPKNIKITSFSILLARYKGDIKEFKKGADYIDKLKPDSKILIAEACTHVPLDEDIGRIKIPRLLKNYLGFDLKIEFSRGNNFPEDLTQYDLIIHCGACMFNKKFMLSRINQAKKQNIKITNYGLAIAKLNNILDKIYF